MSYFPVTPNRSGEILAEGITGSAAVNAQAMSGLGNNIGEALSSIGGIFGEIEGRKAKGRAFKKTLEVLGPSIGMTTDKLKLAFGDLKNDMDYFNASEMLMPVLPSMINLQLGQMNNDTRRQGMGVQMTMPRLREATKAAGGVAAGQATVPPQSFSNINFGIVD